MPEDRNHETAARTFLRTMLEPPLATGRRGVAEEPVQVTDELLAHVAEAPVLKVEGLNSPVKIASMELLCKGRIFLVRVRTAAGDEGIGVPNAMHLIHTYPIFINRVRRSSWVRMHASSSRCSGNCTGTTTITSTRALRSGSAWRPPSSPSSTCSASSPASRSATCSAA